jgi:hypothetical protein
MTAGSLMKNFMTSANSMLTLENLANRYPKLLEDLKRFSLADVLCLCSGLQTTVGLHANSLRLEALTHLAVASCAGVREPKRKDLDRWLNDWLGQHELPRLEDPPEDLFSENVVGPFGNRICFTGLWESVGAFVQDIIDVLQKAPEELGGVRVSVASLLTLSHVVAGNSGVQRFEPGRGHAKQRIALPRNEELAELSGHALIPKVDLRAHGISEEALRPFILDLPAYRNHFHDQSVENSDLLRQPIVDLGDALVLALPGAIGVALQMFVVSAMRDRGEADAFARMLALRQADRVFNRFVPNMDAEPLKWTPALRRPESLVHCVDEGFFSFDRDKVCHLVLIHGGLDTLPEHGPSRVWELDSEAESQIVTFIDERSRELLENADTRAGMTLVVRCGLAGGFSMSWEKPRANWCHAFISLNDLDYLSYSYDASLLTLWKLLDFREELEAKQIALFEFNGLLNLYAYWQQSGHELAPREVAANQGALIQVATNYVQGIRVDVRRRHDPHAAMRHIGQRQSWIVVNRRETHPYFTDVTHSNLYVSHERVRHGILMGIAEGVHSSWWLVCEPADRILPPEGAVRAWDALLHWMGLAVDKLDVVGLPAGPLNVDFRYGTRESWDRDDFQEAPAEEPSVEVLDSRTIRIVIGPGFYRYVSQPDNVAERLLLRRFLEGVHALAGANVEDGWLEECLDSVFDGPDARMIHTYHAKSWRDMASEIRLPKWRRVRDEDSARALFDLMSHDGRDGPQVILGKEKANAALHDAVDRLWARIRTRLQALDQRRTVERLIENIEAAHRELRQWRISARAIRGLHGASASVFDSAMKAERDIQTAIFCSRALIEMTICEAAPLDGASPSNEDIDFLLAGVSQLTYVARCSDALYAGWITPRLVQYQNGTIEVDQSFHNKIVMPYHTQGFRDRFEGNAKRYESAIQPPGAATDEPDIEASFSEAFKEEFGIELTTYTDLVRTLGELALESNVIALHFRTEELCSVLVARLGVQEADVHAFLDRFLLAPRRHWPTHKPQGAESRDWQPWRFRRRLSLVMRPLIGLKGSVPGQLLVAPGMLEEAARFLLQSLEEGSFNPEHCRSIKMRQWLGKAQREESEAFEDTVADAFRKRGLEARVRVSMTSLGAPPERGEIDVLAWSSARRRVLIVECKDLMTAKMEAEVAEQLNRFRGEAGDELGAHMLRMHWLRDHRSALSQLTGLTEPIRMADLLVTSRPVPLQYTDRLPSGAPPIYNFGAIDEALERTRMVTKV